MKKTSMDELGEFRAELNVIDKKIISLLGERYEICHNVAEYKKKHNIPMMQSDRVEEVKQKCAELALAHDVDPDFTRRLYDLIIEEACRLEDIIIDADSC